MISTLAAHQNKLGSYINTLYANDRKGFEKVIRREGEGRHPRGREPHGQRLSWDSVGHMGKTYVQLG